MKIIVRCALSMIFIYGSLLWGMQNPKSYPVELTWQDFDTYHISLFSLNPEFKETAFNKKNAAILNDIKFPLRFPVLTLDILTPTKIFDGNVLQTSFDNPGGDVTTFNALFASHPPADEDGQRWYLVIKIGSLPTYSLKKFKKQYTKNFFQQKRAGLPFLPHITLAQISGIHDKAVFLNAIKKTNKLNKKQQQIFTDLKREDLIFNPACPKHPRPHVMFKIISNNMLTRLKILKGWFEQSLFYEQQIKNEQEAQKTRIPLLVDALAELADKLLKLQLKLI